MKIPKGFKPAFVGATITTSFTIIVTKEQMIKYKIRQLKLARLKARKPNLN